MKQTRELNTKEDKSKELLKQLENNSMLLKNSLKNPYLKAVAFLGIGYVALIASKYIFNALAESITAAKKLRGAVQQ